MFYMITLNIRSGISTLNSTAADLVKNTDYIALLR